MPWYAPAWQVRDMARQQKLESLRDRAYDEQERLEDSYFFITLSRVILDHLEGVVREDSENSFDISALANDALQFFHSTVMAELGVGVFAKTNTERDALVAEYLEKYIIPVALRPLDSALRKQEDEEPVRIYGVEDRMQEIEVERASDG